MKCAICGGEGPFELEACIIDERRPMCDQCASAIDAISDNTGSTESWENSYQWIAKNSQRIRDDKVAGFIEDTLSAAKENPQYAKLQQKINQNLQKEYAARREAEMVAAMDELGYDVELTYKRKSAEAIAR